MQRYFLYFKKITSVLQASLNTNFDVILTLKTAYNRLAHNSYKNACVLGGGGYGNCNENPFFTIHCNIYATLTAKLKNRQLKKIAYKLHLKYLIYIKSKYFIG